MKASIAACFILLLQFVCKGHAQYVNPTTTSALTGIKLTSSSNVIEPTLTRDFYIMCSFPKPADLGLDTIISLVISKGESDTKFKEIASVNIARPHQTRELASVGAKVTGKLDTQGITFIRLEWTFPSENNTGVYVCEANSLNALGHTVLSKTSLRVTSKSPNIQSLVNQFRIFTKQQEDQLRKQNVTNQKLQSQIRTQKDDLRKQNATDRKLLEEVQKDHVSITNMKDQLRKQNATDRKLLEEVQKDHVSISNMKDQLRKQNATDRELRSEIQTQKVTITNMQERLQKQNVVANVTSLRDRVQVLELFDISAVTAGKQYLVSRIGSVNISRAEALCNVAGGHLADIRSSTELDAIKTFMQTLQSTGEFYSSYFSPTQENHPGRWVYRHNGEDMTYTGVWESGQPSSYVYRACALLRHSSWKAYNLKCGGYSNNNFICERSAVI